MNYYNEIDVFCAQRLQQLMDADLIAPGHIDTRSIEDVTPHDLRGYTQCHFFAGIAGWPRALDLAGWPRNRPVWTGSCPCQPFSAAGKGAGFADKRHLWPAWYHLIEQCRPPSVFGEQVASKAVDDWIDLVHADMEAVGYAFGSISFPAAGVGAPHIRDRNYWGGSDANRQLSGRVSGGLADTRSERLPQRVRIAGVPRSPDSPKSWQTAERGDICAVRETGWPGPTNGAWRDADWILGRDGKWRPVEPDTFPLAHGVSDRVGRLRAYGNAIVPQAAAEFIRAYLDTVDI